MSVAITELRPDEGETAQSAEPPARLWRKLRRDPVVLAAVVVLVVVATGALLAPVLATHDPLRNDLRAALQGPSRAHWLGTDDLGRDVYSRILYGARLSLTASLIAVGVGFGIGFPLGLFAGFRGGRWESALLRIADGVLALPGLIVILAVLTVVGNGLVPAMIALGFVLFPTFLRLTRGVAQSIRTEPYIDAAHTLGLPRRRIALRHVLPHVLPALVVHTSLMLGVALLVEAGLSYIGLGTQPPEASWGAMLSKAQSAIRRQPFMAFPPGLAITLTVLSLNLVGDAVRDAVGHTERAPRRRRSDRRRRVAPPSAAERTGAAPALAIDHLTVAFPVEGVVTPVVQDVALTVERGEVVGLVGESGCGKTVTALAAIGLVGQTGEIIEGSIEVAGEQIVGRRERDLRRLRGDRVAMVFQDPSSSLDPAYTVGDQIGESLRLHRGLSRRAARASAVELLRQVGIPDAERRVRAYPHQFSGGMAQRVAISAALACDPTLVIADEPTTALDVTVQAEILDLLRQLQTERDMAILLVTHDLGVVADLCQRAVVMYAGEVVETGTVGQLFSAPQHPYTRELLAAVPRNEHKGGRLPTIPGQVPQPGRWGVGCHFADRCPQVRAQCRAAPIALRPAGDGRSARCVLVDDTPTTTAERGASA